MLPKLAKTFEATFISLIESTIDQLSGLARRVGVLGTPTTLKQGLYGSPLASLGCTVIEPSNSLSRKLEQAIRREISGQPQQEAVIALACDELRASGAERIILGCTELSLLAVKNEETILIDPMDIGIERLLEAACE